MKERIFLCKATEIEEGKLKAVTVEGIELMVTQLGGNFIVASRTCTHKNFDLTNGFYTDGYVTCTLHTSTFDLQDNGRAMNPPAKESLDLYETEIEADKLFILV